MKVVKDRERKKRIRVGISLKPTKIYQAGEQCFVPTFISYMNPESVSAGESILSILEKNRKWGRDEETPIFRNQDGEEISYEESNKELAKASNEANLSDLALDTHLLRIGGATAYANSPSGGELVAGFMELWLTNPKYDYMHATQEKL